MHDSEPLASGMDKSDAYAEADFLQDELVEYFDAHNRPLFVSSQAVPSREGLWRRQVGIIMYDMQRRVYVRCHKPVQALASHDSTSQDLTSHDSTSQASSSHDSTSQASTSHDSPSQDSPSRASSSHDSISQDSVVWDLSAMGSVGVGESSGAAAERHVHSQLGDILALVEPVSTLQYTPNLWFVTLYSLGPTHEVPYAESKLAGNFMTKHELIALHGYAPELCTPLLSWCLNENILWRT